MFPRKIAGLREVADGYDGFIIDLWGVVHNGVTPYAGALRALRALRNLGKPALLLSNAPRRIAPLIARLREIGVADDDYNFLHSSGEETYIHLRDRPDDWHKKLGPRCYHIGPERDLSLFDDLGIERTASVHDSDFILNTGIWDNSQQVKDFEDMLQAARARNLPMLCANPDMVVMIEDKQVICAGAIAARYEQLGGDVRYHGKPHKMAYDRAMWMMGVSNPRKILTIGDSLATDVRGAKNASMAALWILGGIHAERLNIADHGAIESGTGAIEMELKAQDLAPDYMQFHLEW